MGKAKSCTTQRPFQSVLFPWLRKSEDSAKPDAIGHKSACPSGHWRFVTWFDVKTPGGQGDHHNTESLHKKINRHVKRRTSADRVPD